MTDVDDADRARAEVARLRADNQRLRAEVARLRAELYRLGRYLAEPAPGPAADVADAGIDWVYQRGDLDDDLGDD
jgi:hypothetical protein